MTENHFVSVSSVLNLRKNLSPITIEMLANQVIDYYIANEAFPKEIVMGTEQVKRYLTLDSKQEFGNLSFRGIPIKIELPKE